MANFKVHGYQDIDNGAKRGWISLRFKPKGYWSEVIDLCIKRDFNAGSVPMSESHSVWQTSISLSSGGRDTDSVPCDIEATGYFMEALAFARAFCNTIPYAGLETSFQHERTRRREEYETKRAKA